MSAPLPLLMLPGTLCDARVFAPMAAAFAREPAGALRHIHYAGMTELPSVTALADRILDAAPVHFIAVGFSLGGIVALELAARAPTRVRGMVLIAANARDVPTELHERRRIAAREPVERLVGEILWPDYVAPQRRNDRDLRKTILAMAQAAPPGTSEMQTEVALSRVDSRPRLAAMAMPALVIGGEMDAIAPPALQHELAKGLPAATLKMLPTGHFAPLEDARSCALALAEWLGRVEPAIIAGRAPVLTPRLSEIIL